jgi:hypothetical protein
MGSRFRSAASEMAFNLETGPRETCGTKVSKVPLLVMVQLESVVRRKLQCWRQAGNLDDSDAAGHRRDVNTVPEHGLGSTYQWGELLGGESQPIRHHACTFWLTLRSEPHTLC